MPEIRLGAGENMADIRLGSVQIVEVRIGDALVWRNNARPVFTTFQVDGTDVAAGANLTRDRATQIVLSWTAQDMEPAGISDNIVAFRVIRNGGTPIPVSVSTPSPTESGTYTIVASIYDAFEFSGVLPTPEVWRVEAEDSVGSVGSVEFNITEFTFDAPRISPRDQEVVGSAESHSFPYTSTPAANAINLNTSNQSGTETITAACTDFARDDQNTISRIVTSITSGDNGSSQTDTVTYTYSRTQTDGTSTFVPGTIQSGTEVITPTGTCTPTSTTSCGEILATCTNRPGTGAGVGRTPRTQDRRDTTFLVCDPNVSNDVVTRVSISDSTRNIPSGVSCNTASYTNPGQLPAFPGWAVPTIAQVAGGSGACTVTCPGVSATSTNGQNSASGTSAASQSTIGQGSMATVSCTGNIPSGFQNAGGSTPAASANLVCNRLPDYSTTVTLASGEDRAGETITASDVSGIAAGGTFVSSSPATYTIGITEYTITISVAGAFFNAGGTVTPTATIANPTAAIPAHPTLNFGAPTCVGAGNCRWEASVPGGYGDNGCLTLQIGAGGEFRLTSPTAGTPNVNAAAGGGTRVIRYYQRTSAAATCPSSGFSTTGWSLTSSQTVSQTGACPGTCSPAGGFTLT